MNIVVVFKVERLEVEQGEHPTSYGKGMT